MRRLMAIAFKGDFFLDDAITLLVFTSIFDSARLSSGDAVHEGQDEVEPPYIEKHQGRQQHIEKKEKASLRKHGTPKVACGEKHDLRVKEQTTPKPKERS